VTNIPVFKPLIEEEELRAVRDSLEVGWLGMGKSVGEFEEAISALLGLRDRYVAAVSTGHAALHLAILVAGLEEGSEIITPAFNNVADFQAITAAGCKPVFCDILEDTLCIDPKSVENLIGPNTKAIITMDYFCCLADHEAIASIAARYGLRVIHDAAHSFGSIYKGEMIGTFSDLCMFSFDPVKTITCIDGGVLLVRSEEELSQVRKMRLIGMNQSATKMYENQRAWNFDVDGLGYRYHLSNPHAAMGLAQLAKMPLITKTRRLSCRLYSNLLRDIPEVTVPASDFVDVTPFLYYIRVPEKCRDKFRAHLTANGIDTGVHWQPGHHFSLFAKAKSSSLQVTDKISKEIVSLPLHSNMSEETVEFIASTINDFFIESR